VKAVCFLPKAEDPGRRFFEKPTSSDEIRRWLDE
jgi:hypothetical protein